MLCRQRLETTISNVASGNWMAVASPSSTSTFSCTPSISALRSVRSRVLPARSTLLHGSITVPPFAVPRIEDHQNAFEDANRSNAKEHGPEDEEDMAEP